MTRQFLQPGEILIPDRRRSADTIRPAGYRIRRKLDAGGFGITYEAEKIDGEGDPTDLARHLWTEPMQRVVIKEFFPEFARRDGHTVVSTLESDPSGIFQRALDRFRREAERLCILTVRRALLGAVADADRRGYRDAEIAAADAVIEAQIGVGGRRRGLREALEVVGHLTGRNRKAAQAALRESPLPTVYDFFEVEGTAYYVMEFLEGGTLKERLSEARRFAEQRVVLVGDKEFTVTTPWPYQRLMAFVDECLNALHELHTAMPGQQLVHCDLKPGNIMFRARDSERPVLIDFGLTRDAQSDASQSLDAGTIGWASVELDPATRRSFLTQAAREGRARADIGPWTDIYAMGMLFRLLATGIDKDTLPPALERRFAQLESQPDPFDSLPPLPLTLPKAFRTAIDEATKLAPWDRPSSVANWRNLFQLDIAARPKDQTWTTDDEKEDEPPPPPLPPPPPPPQPPPDDESQGRQDSKVREDHQVGGKGRSASPVVVVLALVAAGLASATVFHFATSGDRYDPDDAVAPSSQSVDPSTAADLAEASGAAEDAATSVDPRPLEPPFGQDAAVDQTPAEVATAVSPREPEPAPPPASVTPEPPPPPLPLPPPPPPPPAGAPMASARTLALDRLGLTIRTMSSRSQVDELDARGLDPNEPVIVTQVNTEIAGFDGLRANDVVARACDATSALTAFQRAERGQEVCVILSDRSQVILR